MNDRGTGRTRERWKRQVANGNGYHMPCRLSALRDETGGQPRIVLIRPGALGDALLTLPALALLRHARLGAHVTLIARRDVLSLVMASGLADATYPYDLPVWSALFAASGAEADPLARRVLAGAEVVAWMPDNDGAIAANLRTLGALRTLVAPARPLLGEREHMALRLIGALRPLGVDVPPTREALIELLPDLNMQESDAREASAQWDGLALQGGSQPVIALHPGSGGLAKRWPARSFAALASDLTAMSMRPLLVEGPQDGEVCAELLAASRGALPIARGQSVPALAALLRRCVAYVGNDSGVSHLAGMLGVPTLALFGPTDPELWTPLGSRVRVLCAPDSSLARLPPTEVATTLRELLGEDQNARRSATDAKRRQGYSGM